MLVEWLDEIGEAQQPGGATGTPSRTNQIQAGDVTDRMRALGITVIKGA